MPNIIVKIPHGAFTGDARSRLVQAINNAAAVAEQIPAEPRRRALCWVIVEEVEPSNWTLGTADVSAQIVHCMAVVYVPAGVLDDASRSNYVRLMHEAFQQALPDGDQRKLLTSVVLQEVADGAWGVNGAIWQLPAFASAAGYAHLQQMAAAMP
jgi:phenylpyruvate tautomerase PptA (4-oxalocrotonate tautomerase family)